jgi:hypothetical protein
LDVYAVHYASVMEHHDSINPTFALALDSGWSGKCSRCRPQIWFTTCQSRHWHYTQSASSNPPRNLWKTLSLIPHILTVVYRALVYPRREATNRRSAGITSAGCRASTQQGVRLFRTLASSTACSTTVALTVDSPPSHHLKFSNPKCPNPTKSCSLT